MLLACLQPALIDMADHSFAPNSEARMQPEDDDAMVLITQREVRLSLAFGAGSLS